ncbi:MAG: Rieske (2Fe-2S) protein [Saccharopolyspora sp.]|uniref:Rieske (2Fe-2S) protein n=1 Tax=Saccharopolyspora TaxID=1835 RepID=UPI00190A4BFC|nr:MULTISPECIES: Rieske (2Fe-2S) protein [unclassified Saccharopolyspora]MBK0870488.1 Rieske (2Fe-2S) protein [Saccharopolyspora sp. HNM0986]MBQ6642948.1 Rieske (2Fe-2S) protein [Saccharopolyspora sp.]
MTATPVARQAAARSDEVPEGGRHVVDIAGTTIGLFRFQGVLHAYENVCPHQGGPVCQGRLVSRVTEKLDADKRSRGLDFDTEDLHIVCPWHGFEYSLATGSHPGRPQIKLRAFDVEEAEGTIYVHV